jgi:hypothetical protein
MVNFRKLLPAAAIVLALAPYGANARSYSPAHDQALNYFAANAATAQVAVNSKGRPGENHVAVNSKGRPGENQVAVNSKGRPGENQVAVNSKGRPGENQADQSAAA